MAGSDHKLLVGVTETSKRAGSAQGLPHSSVVPLGQRAAKGALLKGRHLEVTLLMPRGYSTLSPKGPNPTSPALLPQNTLASLPPCSQEWSHPILSNSCILCPSPSQRSPGRKRGAGTGSRDKYFKQGYCFQVFPIFRVCSSGTSRALRICLQWIYLPQT